MRISTFLPHVGVFGGVRRFIELGNAWRALGHEVTLFHPAGTPPEWLEYRGRVAPLAAAAAETADLAVCADPHTFDAFAAHAAGTHLYYCVIEGDPGAARAHADPRMLLAANSGRLRRALSRRGKPVLDGVGGINLEQFHPDTRRLAEQPLRILLNGRRSRPKKGTDLILRALRGLEKRFPIEIVLFDSLGAENRQDPRDGAPLPPGARFVLDPSQAELVALYQGAHLFIAAERKAGWCNTALEAMACGCAVACTRSGTADFARDGENALVVAVRHPFFIRRAVTRLLADPALRERLSGAGPPTAAHWTWDMLAKKLLDQLAAGGKHERRALAPAAGKL
jgi:glycosyltransferase involved in cell wall biosynthesis